MKNVAVIISGQGQDNLREVELSPGTTTRDVLKALKLTDTYLLSHDGDPQPFAPDEELYEQVRDGAKLRCAPRATVGLPVVHAEGSCHERI
jgi:hypothetical protein